MNRCMQIGLGIWLGLASAVAVAQAALPPAEEVSKYILDGNWLALQRIGEARIKANPAEYEGYRLRGLALLGLLEPQRAIPDLELVAKNFPSRGLFWFNLGRAYLAAAQPDQAIEAFKTGIANEPDYDLNWQGLWDAYDRSGRDDLIAPIRERLAARKSQSLEWGKVFTNGSEQWSPQQRSRELQARAAPRAAAELRAIDPKSADEAARGVAAWEAGRLAEATGILEPLLERMSGDYGRLHPGVLQLADVLVIAYIEQLKPDKALAILAPARRLDQAVQLARNNVERRQRALGPESEQTIRAEAAMAYLEFNNGDAREAVRDALLVRDKANRLLGASSPTALWSEWLFCAALLQKGQMEEAIAYAGQLIKRAAPILGEGSFFEVGMHQVIALANQGLMRPKEAARHAEIALADARRLLGDQHRSTILAMGMTVGTLALSGETARATARQQEVLGIIRRTYGADSPEEASTLIQAAVALMALGRYQESAEMVRRSLKWYEERLGANSPYVTSARMLMFFAYYQQGLTGASTRVFRELGPVLENDYQKVDSGDAAGVQRFAPVSTFYKLFASTIMFRDPVDGFEVAESAKARTLLESSALATAAKSGLIPAADQQTLDALTGSLAAAESNLAATLPGTAEHSVYEVQRQQQQIRLGALVTDLKQRFPKYRQATEVKSLSAKEGLALFDEDTAFISYVTVNQILFGFGLSRTHGLEVQWLGEARDLEGRVEQIRRGLDPENAGDRAFAYGAPALKEISDLLLGRFAKTLAGKKKVLISPDGPLAFLPFEILPLNGKPLVSGFDVAYTPSLSVYALMKQRAGEYAGLSRKSLFSMGGAPYDTAAPAADARGSRGGRLGGSASQAARQDAFRQARGFDKVADQDGARSAFRVMDIKWTNLPGTVAEVGAVAALFPNEQVTTALGADASEERLRGLNASGELAQYRYLHFAAHGYFNPEEPALSAIVLKQTGNPPGIDGFVTAVEWPGYSLKSDLIVMSACETGVGKFVQGSGVTGLPYALYVAGNASLVLTLWQVADEATTKFVVSFFGKLRGGMSKGAALAQTKREFIADPKFAHPAYWAGFVFYGD